MITKNQRPLKILPAFTLIEQIWDYIISRPLNKNEKRKSIHECLFLLGWKAGLRVGESIKFDLSLEHPEPKYKNLFYLRGKGKKERWVYVREEIVEELKKRSWMPQLTGFGRVNFFRFLKQVKKEMKISENIELSPHTLRRCFATYNTLNGMPLPVLQKVLGHSAISTTALYIKDVDLENLVKYKPI